ncbi:hypothetical protein ACLB2K_074254 [Fragaria x ananassa]
MVRIRKNSKLSPLLFCSQPSALDDLQPSVCKLNQSPWDANHVIVPSLLDSSHPFEAEDGLYVNGSLGSSIVAEESVASPMDIDDKPDTAAVHGSVCTDCNGFRRCHRNNGKSWQCNTEAREGLTHCENHSKLKSRRNVNYCIYTNENNKSNTTSNGTANSLPSKKAIAAAKALPGTRRPKVVAKKGEAALKNPYEFYYYSGFNPRWGRDRGISKHKEAAKVAAAENVGATPTTSCTTTQISNPESPPSHKIDNGDQLDYIEDDFDDDEDEDGGGECGRKRMRRHVKARSLKSLM